MDDAWQPCRVFLMRGMIPQSHAGRFAFDRSALAVGWVTDGRAEVRLIGIESAARRPIGTRYANPEIARDVVVLSVDDTRQVTAAGFPSHETLVGWAPAGRRLLFTSDRTGEPESAGQPVGVGRWCESVAGRAWIAVVRNRNAVVRMPRVAAAPQG